VGSGGPVAPVSSPADLAAQLARYRAMVDHATEGIAVGQSGVVRYANRRCLELLAADDIAGHSMMDYIHPEDRERVAGFRERRMRGEDIAPYETRLRARDGTLRWVEISGGHIDWDGAPATLLFLKDITERHALHEATQKALVRERELGELKTRLLSMASHEFRTPLAAILSSAELVGHYGERLGAEEQRTIMADLVAAARRMQVMLEDMLTLGLAESGRVAFQPKLADVEALCRQSLAEVRAAQPAHRLTMRTVRGGAREVDARLVQYILVNLLTNACKYSPDGSEVLLTLDCGDEVCIEVSDKGIGIPPEDVPHLFESFRRGGNSGHRPGSGLGLAIVQRSAQLHGGKVDVVSTLGVGSTFTVRLPAP
jgi:PAS domain S-box-containing protein